MGLVWRKPVANDVTAIAELAAGCQADPRFHIPYVGLSAGSIASDIEEVPDWTARSIVAEDAGRIVGALIAEVEDDMGRLWWWGPFLSEEDPDRWSALADRFHSEVRSLVPDAIDQEEACADIKSTVMNDWCCRHGLVAETASVLLRRPKGPATSDQRVRPLAERDHETVKALHDLAFPGTHATPEALVAADDPRFVIEVDQEGRDPIVGGYVAYELQSDGSGYIDFLAVNPELRSNGLGAALVSTACQAMHDGGATHAHLTVRENNAPARALYAKLGFIEDRIVRPYRKGFALDG